MCNTCLLFTCTGIIKTCLQRGSNNEKLFLSFPFFHSFLVQCALHKSRDLGTKPSLHILHSLSLSLSIPSSLPPPPQGRGGGGGGKSWLPPSSSFLFPLLPSSFSLSVYAVFCTHQIYIGGTPQPPQPPQPPSDRSKESGDYFRLRRRRRRE